MHKRKEPTVADKVRLAESVSHSQLIYNASTWPQLNGAQERQFSRQYVSNYAAAQGITWKTRRDKEVSNEQVLEGVDRPTHTDLLRLERLRRLGRVLEHGPAHLRRLFAQGWWEGYG